MAFVRAPEFSLSVVCQPVFPISSVVAITYRLFHFLLLSIHEPMRRRASLTQQKSGYAR